MKKKLCAATILFWIFHAIYLNAQFYDTVIVTHNIVKSPYAVTVDTISPGTSIFLGPSVHSFTACVVVHGRVVSEQKYNGNTMVTGDRFRIPGTIIIIDNIVSKETDGSFKKRPAKKYIVR
jgi:hypothetical protein